MLYYTLVLISVIMFGGQFFFNRMYQQACGSSLRTSFVFTFFTSLTGASALFILNGFHFHTTPFTLLVAFFMAINTILFSFFAIKSLGMINLSLFSVFSMMGGMALPFITGILCFGEELTVAKSVCFALVAVSIAFTFDRNGQKGGGIYYFGIFLFNGMSGVLSMIFNRFGYDKASAADVSVLSALFRVVISAVALVIIRASKKQPEKLRLTAKTGLSLVLCGIFSIVANYLLLIALKHIPGSMQYPMVTGGVMIVSTVLGFFTSKKPRMKDVVSVAIAFSGILALLLKI